MSLVVEVIGSAGLYFEPVERFCSTGKNELGVNDLAVADQVGLVVHEAFISDFETVAFLDFALEIHVPTIDADKFS